MKLRVVVKRPRTTQTAHDAWQDTSYFQTFDVPATEALATAMAESKDAVIWATAVIDDDQREGGEK